MKRDISSRERMLAAINHQEADRVPIIFRGLAPLDHLWHDKHERVDVLLKLGVDEKITIGIGFGVHPDVTVRDWFDENSDPQYRLACREYHTPKGVLRTVARCTEDCPYDCGVPLFSDHNVARSTELLVKSREDLPKLSFLLQRPTQEMIAAFREGAKREKDFAAQQGLLVEGAGGAGGDAAVWLCGVNRLIYQAYDDPEFIEELMDLIYTAEAQCLEVMLDEGVDTVDVRGCYETAPMWSAQWFDRLFAPRLERKAKLIHQADAKLSFFSTGDLAPHLDTLRRAGVDIINAIRPFPGGTNGMRVLKARIGQDICLWGGINPEESIELCSVEETRRDVLDVLLTAAPGGGFVLSTGGSVCTADCYDNVTAFIETAGEFGAYPIDTVRLEAELKQCSEPKAL